jgi:hypothetical protein
MSSVINIECAFRALEEGGKGEISSDPILLTSLEGGGVKC